MSTPSLSKRIIGSMGANIILLVVQLVMLIVRSRELSVSEQGLSALFIVNIDLIAQLSMFVGGSALVYMASRANMKSLAIISYGWSLIAAMLMFGLLYLVGQLDDTYLAPIFLAGLLQCIYAANLNLVLGLNRIAWYNSLQVVLAASTLGLLIYFFQNDGASFEDFLYAYLGGVGVSTLLSFFPLWGRINWKDKLDLSVLKEMGNYGFVIQLGNFAQRLNNRLALYLLEASYLVGLAMVGLFSNGQSSIEKLMLASRSLSSVQYAEISNSRDEKKAALLSLRFMRICIALTLLGILTIIVIPESLWLTIFSDKYVGIKDIMMGLSPAVFILAVSNIFSHYFSGLGNYRINTAASVLGLVVTVLCGYALIPQYGIEGCIYTISASYATTCCFQLFYFRKEVKISIKDFILRWDDLKMK